MAELSSERKRPVKKHEPSRLRNEIHLDSSDDGIGLEKTSIGQSRSNDIVSEALPDSGQVFTADGSIDIVDEAIIKRNAVTKTTDTEIPAPIIIKPLSKALMCSQEGYTSSPSTTFSFMPARKVPVRAPGKATHEEDVANAHPKAQGSSASANLEQEKDPAGHGNYIGAMQPTHSPTLPLECTKHDAPDQFSYQSMNNVSILSPVPDTSRHGSTANRRGSEPLLPLSFPFTHEQTGSESTCGPKKVHTFTVDKKGEKGEKSVRNQRAGPWPSRSTYRLRNCNLMSKTLQPLVELSNPQNLSFPKAHNFHIDDKPDEVINALDSQSGNTHHHIRITSQTPSNPGLRQKMEPFNPTHQTPQDTLSCVAESSSRSVTFAPQEQMLSLSSKQLPVTDLRQPLENVDKELTTVLSTSPDNFPSDIDATPLPSIGAPKIYHGIDSTLGCMGEQFSQPFQPKPGADELRKPIPQSDEATSDLRTASCQKDLQRIRKIRTKRQATSRPLARLSHGTHIAPEIENSLENLRIALLADQFRIKHENVTTNKLRDEDTAKLREQLSSQSKSAAEWKERHQDLRTSMNQLTDKAKTSQKFVTGLQKDFERLQKQVSIFYDQSKRTLQEKIDEIESEKTILYREFNITLDVLSRSQRNLRGTVDEFYMRLVQCESEKRTLAEILCMQNTLYKEECIKRVELEKQLGLSLQAMQHQFGDFSLVLTEKVDNLQSSFRAIASKENPNSPIEECLKILHNLEKAPFLTTKDTHKAEGVLRFIHERVESGLAALAGILKNKQSSMDEIQNFIGIQIRNLRSDMVEYNEVMTENRRLCESNISLRHQLEQQEQHVLGLNKQIQSPQQSNVDLDASSVHLECELAALNGQYINQDKQSLAHREEMFETCQQRNPAQEELRVARMKIKQAEGIQLRLEGEVDKHKRMYGACKLKLLEMGKKMVQSERTKSTIGLWKKSAQQFQKYFSDREIGLQNNIHRLTIERKDIEAQFEDQKLQAFAAKNQLHDLRNSVKTLTCELEAERLQKENINAKSILGPQIAQGCGDKTYEIASLQEQLRVMTDKVQSVTQNCEALQIEKTGLTKKATDLQGSCDQLHHQVCHLNSTIETLRNDSSFQLLEDQQKAKESFQSVQDDNASLRQHNRDLLSKLEQTESTEAKLYNAQASFISERNSLQQHVAELQSTNEAQKDDMFQIEIAFAEEKQKMRAQHDTEVSKWKCRFTQTNATLMEVEAKVRCMEADQTRLELDHQETERRFHLLQREREQKSHGASTCSGLNKRQISHSVTPAGGSSPFPRDHHTYSDGKTAGRQNQSAFNEATMSSTRQNIPKPIALGDESPFPSKQREDLNPSATLCQSESYSSFGIGDLSEDCGISVVDPAAEAVPETQALDSYSNSLEMVEREINQQSLCEKEVQVEGSTDLSSINSEELTHMQTSVAHLSSPKLLDQVHESSSIAFADMDVNEADITSDSIPATDFYSSRRQDRLKSQANTASRLMPPPNMLPLNIKCGIQDHNDAINAFSQHTMRRGQARQLSSSSSSSTTSSLDFMHPLSTPKLMYDDESSSLLAFDQYNQNTPPFGKPNLQKRKQSPGKVNQGAVRKKQRTPLRSGPNSPASKSKEGVFQPHKPSPKRSSTRPKLSSFNPDPTSTVVPREIHRARSSSNTSRLYSQNSPLGDKHESQVHEMSSSQPLAASFTRRTSSRLAKSKSQNINERYDDRFSQELGTR